MFFYFQRKLHKSRIYVDCASGQGKKQVPHNVRTPGRGLGTSHQGTRRQGSVVTAAGQATRFLTVAYTWLRRH